MITTADRAWLTVAVLGFLLFFFLPLELLRPIDVRPIGFAVAEGVALLHDYAREHVILCLLPAFLIAGGMTVYISQAAVLRLLGPDANQAVALGVGSLGGMVLAVCSCTVLPLFAGLYKRGAGLGPAVAFLFTGPAINVIAIVLTMKVLGVQLGIARAVGAVVFALVIGVVMAWLYRHEPREAGGLAALPDDGARHGRVVLLFASMMGVLVFANWAAVDASASAIWATIHGLKWWIAGGFGLVAVGTLAFGFGWRLWPLAGLTAAVALAAAFAPVSPMAIFAAGFIGLVAAAWWGAAGDVRDDARDWMAESWSFAKQILPLLVIGVFVAGFLLGRPGEAGLIPERWVAALVGGESLQANLFASLVGSLMYFATLTEVPIVQGLRASGMGEGPSLALLLAGPALSLPNMLAIRAIMGTQKTAVYVALVVVMATIAGLVYGAYIAL